MAGAMEKYKVPNRNVWDAALEVGAREQWTVRDFSPAHTKEICSWVKTGAELRMISGNTGERITPDILHEWESNSIASLVCLSFHHNIHMQLSGFMNENLSENGFAMIHESFPFALYLLLAERVSGQLGKFQIDSTQIRHFVY